MKKILATLVAALLVACLTVPAFAANAEVEKANIPSAEIGEGKAVASGDTDTTVVENQNTVAKDSLSKTVDALNAEQKKDGGILYLVDVSTSNPGKTAKIKFKMPNGKELAFVLYYDSANNKWQRADATYTDGVLTVSVTSGQAPVAVVVSSVGSSSPVSPQTGETVPAVYAACAVMLSAAAVAFVVKSRKAA